MKYQELTELEHLLLRELGRCESGFYHGTPVTEALVRSWPDFLLEQAAHSYARQSRPGVLLTLAVGEWERRQRERSQGNRTSERMERRA